MNPKTIAFTHGGAPAPAPVFSSTLGDTKSRRGLYGRAPERQRREGRKFGMDLQPEALRWFFHRKLFVGSSPGASECPDASFQLKDKLRFEKK